VNSIPTRLDLDDIHVRRALGLDVKVAINSDAHHPGGLDSIPFGLATARRGWATSPDVLNSMRFEDLLAWRKARINRQLSTKEGNHVAV
jgi:DNA polymerase (family 10)